MTTELEHAIGIVLTRANRKFDAAIAALQPPPTGPQLTPAEALGILAGSLRDALQAFATDFNRGYNSPPGIYHLTPTNPPRLTIGPTT